MKSKEKVYRAVKKAGVIRAREIRAGGLSSQALSDLVREGRIRRVARGLYAAEGATVSEWQSLIETALLIPSGVFCLLTALQFHGLTTQSPFEVWVAIGEKQWRPRLRPQAVRLAYFSGEALTSGIERHRIQGTEIKVYSPAKTVADCFKYRYKIGLDVAIAALRDGLRRRKCAIDDLWHFAKVCRVSRVMKPYLEALS